jgi:osmotically-inducible protein OsmY
MKTRGWAMLGGLGLGAGLMYILGSRREGDEEATGSLAGVLSEATDAFGAAEDDEVLEDRVRARLRRVVADADELGVSVKGGVVTLTGAVRATQFDRVVSAALKVRGVHDVDDQLEVRPTGG